MAVTVNVNGLSMCHEGSGGWVRATLPDICLTPAKGGYPVPYPNIAYSRDLRKGSQTVVADGGNSCAIKPSEFYRSFGDEAGKGGGITSQVNQHRATWLSWSADVFIEGEPVCRLSDKMMMNRGNTVSVGGEQQPPLDMEDWLAELCEIACECKNASLFQACVAQKLKDKYYDGDYPKADSPYWQEVSMSQQDGKWGVITNKAGDAPTSNPITPSGGIRPDIVTTDGKGNPTRIVELKFPGDTPNANQVPGGKYSAAARDLDVDYDVIDIAVKCAFCWDPPPPGLPQPVPGPSPVPVPAPAPKPVPEPAPEPEHSTPWGWIIGGAVAVGIVVCIIAEPCGVAVGGGILLGGGLAVGATA